MGYNYDDGSHTVFLSTVGLIQERRSVLAAECESALLTFSSAHSCNPPEALSQSEIVLSLRRICLTHHLQKWESYLTEIKKWGNNDYTGIQ